MRGADESAPHPAGKGVRFIPTCVGQMFFLAADHRVISVHPHVRGADDLLDVQSGKAHPVHPHVRGADFSIGLVTVPLLRFIPTCVGQIIEGSVKSLKAAVHPHVRGADVNVQSAEIIIQRFIPTCVGQMRSAQFSVATVYGSSPRAWGRFIEAGEHQP